ncbi:MAG: ABC transporter permease, partial [Ruminococcus sp.]|nr:ABC transporter permease [Ruminococcus sp.]
MKNPLIKRFPRELKSEFGKYLIIFLFIAGTISIVSGWNVAGNSMSTAYDESFDKYSIEDGNFELYSEADESLISDLETDSLNIYKNFYIERSTKEIDSTLRVFHKRDKINLECIMEGEFPASDKEIAIDRMYADNNKLSAYILSIAIS